MKLFELFDFMPPQGTEWAARVDWLNNWITSVAVLCTILVTGVMLWFCIKYRRKEGNTEATSQVSHNTLLETVWTVIPTLVVIYVFAYGFFIYKDMRTPPTNALEIEVLAQKWSWEFTYPNGKKAKDLTIPLGKPVRLIMTSKDVLHSFFVPQMRVKEDVIKGRYSYLWFTPNKLGKSYVFCAEYCGTLHSKMISTLIVVSQEEYEDFLTDRTPGEKIELTPAEEGQKLFALKGCVACHSTEGIRQVGPGLKGVSSKKGHEMLDGSKLDVDENYLRESILNPGAKVVKGFAPVMQSFDGQLSEEELSQLIAYLKTL